MKNIDAATRVAYSPGEFAALFGKSQTWGYRQIYGGKVNAITEHGRILIPAKEVERVLESAGIYNGREKPKQQKARAAKLNIEDRGVWKRFLESRKKGKKPEMRGKIRKARPGPCGGKASSREAVTKRVSKSWRKKSSAH